MQKLTTDLKELEAYLQAQVWLKPGESLERAEKPGEGNMNFTLRLVTNQRSFIVKQSRAYVEKYPQVSAPRERALREAEFYGLIAGKTQLAQKMPELLAVDKVHCVLLLEDLGEGADFTNLYKSGQQIEKAHLVDLMEFAAALHNAFSVDEVAKPITNREMRALNHEHMYVYPYLEENGLDLDDVLPGLQEVASAYKQDEPLKAKARTLGERYLADGEKLLHGDYFPGSWLQTSQGLKVIDPEFCFFGPAEFEVGVCLAHLKMADQPAELIDLARATYRAKAPLNEALCQAFMSGEIIRRILGLAQLPLEIGLEKRIQLLSEARQILIRE